MQQQEYTLITSTLINRDYIEEAAMILVMKDTNTIIIMMETFTIISAIAIKEKNSIKYVGNNLITRSLNMIYHTMCKDITIIFF